jgi:hypothetical protein
MLLVRKIARSGLVRKKNRNIVWRKSRALQLIGNIDCLIFGFGNAEHGFFIVALLLLAGDFEPVIDSVCAGDCAPWMLRSSFPARISPVRAK